MTTNKRLALILLVALAAFVVCRVIVGGIVYSGSGGLGAVSFGLSEALLEASLLALALTAVLCGWAWWRKRRPR